MHLQPFCDLAAPWPWYDTYDKRVETRTQPGSLFFAVTSTLITQTITSHLTVCFGNTSLLDTAAGLDTLLRSYSITAAVRLYCVERSAVQISRPT